MNCRFQTLYVMLAIVLAAVVAVLVATLTVLFVTGELPFGPAEESARRLFENTTRN